MGFVGGGASGWGGSLGLDTEFLEGAEGMWSERDADAGNEARKGQQSLWPQLSRARQDKRSHQEELFSVSSSVPDSKRGVVFTS